MSTQLTLKNTFPWRAEGARASATEMLDRLVESTSIDPKQIHFVRHGKRTSMARLGELRPRWEGDLEPQQRVLLGTLFAPGVAIELSAVARCLKNDPWPAVYLELASNDRVVVSRRLDDDRTPFKDWDAALDHPQTLHALTTLERAAADGQSRLSLKAYLPWLLGLLTLGMTSLLLVGAGIPAQF
ncbi:MAG: hypothetical protein RLZZ153_2530 [Pseudomonadota bacterium]|jgi:hypothetical protein